MATSNVQSISRMAGLWVALGICGAQVTSRPVFLKREVISDSEKAQILNSLLANFTLSKDNTLPIVLKPSPQYDPPIRQNYDQIDPEKSLLIHDCKKFCADPELSFATVFKKAAARMGLSDEGKASKSWYLSAARTIPSFEDYAQPWDGQKPDGAPFQLLAVVNRMDLATTECDAKDSGCSASEPKWQNAELHFVYGLVQDKQAAEFTLIIEFVLPPLDWHDFRTIEGKWNDLGKPSDDGTYAKQLRAVLSAMPPASSVRLRTNSAVQQHGGGPWFLAQWGFAKDGLSPSSLPDEIRLECKLQPDDPFPFSSIKSCPQPEAQKCTGFAKLWDDYAQAPTAPHLAIPYAQLLPMTQCYSAGAPLHYSGMNNLAGKCSKSDLWARNVIALQQCSLCHGAETNNSQFTHIHNREPGTSKADLSDFLKGKKPKPSIDELNNLDPNAVFTATMTINTPGCDKPTQTITRPFHDLARRSAFLAAVLVNGPDKLPDRDLTKIIEHYGPDFTH
jgi:hypothetical protein